MSPPRRVLILEPEGFSEQAARRLGEVFEVDLGPLSRDELLGRVGAYHGVIVRLGHRFDRTLLEAADQLRFIASPTTGLNHIDLGVAAERGVAVLSLRGERAFLDSIQATAEHAWALLMALLRRIPAAHASVLNGEWDRDRFKSYELNGRTLGIVGFGRLGTKMAHYARAFGMRVVAHDPYVALPDDVDGMNLGAVFECADVVSLHASYGPDTEGLVGSEHFSRCRPGALFINTARGEIVREADLVQALRNGWLAGAALDVLCGENMPGGPAVASSDLHDYARTHDNLILTPHVGGATFESMARTEEFIVGKVLAFVAEATAT